MANNDASSVEQCKCGTWFNRHPSGKCKVCRYLKPKPRKARRTQQRQPAPGSLEWTEARGGLIGGYEED